MTAGERASTLDAGQDGCGRKPWRLPGVLRYCCAGDVTGDVLLVHLVMTARHCLLALGLMLAASASAVPVQAVLPSSVSFASVSSAAPASAFVMAAADQVEAGPAGVLVAGRRHADLPWPDGLAFGMRQSEVEALSPAATPRKKALAWATLPEDRMAVQVLTSMVAGPEGAGGKRRLSEQVAVGGVALEAHYHFVLNRLTAVLAMPEEGWRPHAVAREEHAVLTRWLTARHGPPRVVPGSGRGKRVRTLHSEWSLPGGGTVVLVLLRGGGDTSLLGLGLRL